MVNELRNWAGNYSYTAARRHEPASVEHVVEIVKSSEKVHALGTRHSFSAVADTPGDLISLKHVDRIIRLDGDSNTVTIEAGVRYGELGSYLHSHGYALHNLASLPHITVAGACATATHGSGQLNRNLATAVASMELITANGTLLNVSRKSHGEQFDGMVVHLGGLGIVTRLTLNIMPTFNIRQNVYENLPTDAIASDFDTIMGTAYSVSLFTQWRPGVVNQVWLKECDADTRPLASTFFGATLAPADRHPIDGLSAENCTGQMNIPGPWHERLPHFKFGFRASSGDELQSEYFVARDDAVAAFRAIAHLHERITPLLQISEIRAIAADALWMSPCYQRDSVAFHFTWKPDWPNVAALLPAIESALAPFNPRPHWAKLFTIPPAVLRQRYPRLHDFAALQRQLDPQGKFRNPFLDQYLGA